MSLRYDMTAAAGAPVSTCHPHDVGDTMADSGAVALVIGDPNDSAQAVVGTLAELRRFAQRVTAEVNALEHGLPEPEDDE